MLQTKNMFQIGDWIIVPGPGTYFALTLVAGSIITTAIGGLLFFFRTKSYTMALKQFKQDFPETKVVTKKKYKDGVKQLVDIETNDGRIITYQINKQDEIATLVRAV